MQISERSSVIRSERRLTKVTASKDSLIRCATYKQGQRKVYPYLRRSLVSFFLARYFPAPYLMSLKTQMYVSLRARCVLTDVFQLVCSRIEFHFSKRDLELLDSRGEEDIEKWKEKFRAAAQGMYFM